MLHYWQEIDAQKCRTGVYECEDELSEKVAPCSCHPHRATRKTAFHRDVKINRTSHTREKNELETQNDLIKTKDYRTP